MPIMRIMAPALSIREICFFLRNVRTRMPFKYGKATLTSVPILHALMEVELADGARATGAAADILPPKWFDKDPAKSYEDNVADLIWTARAAADAYREAGRGTVFEIWRAGYENTLAAGDRHRLNHLTAGHGSSLMERALIDALQQGRILGAGLDTQEKEPADPTNPLLTLPNVTLTPHTAGPTVDSFRKRFQNGYANVQRVATGQPPWWIIPEMRDLFPD